MALIKHSVRTVRKPCEKCGASDLYWAHDMDGKPGKHYCSEHGSANFTLINKDGTRHDCQGKYAASGVAESSEPEAVEADSGSWVTETKPLPPPPAAATPPPASPAADDRMGALAALLDLLAPKVDASQVQSIIDDRLRGLVLPVQVEVSRNGETKPVEGLAHKALPLVITILADGDHVLMVGPAGTGKSHIAHQAADALSLESHGISLSPQTPASALLGYMQAAGEYVATQFRHCYEHGGVFHFDEMDNAHPSTLAVINGALANGHMDFPDGRVKRHEDFRAVGSANTYGRGPDRAYVGRQAIDAATMDRFEVVDVEYDLALEEALCLATGLDGIRVKRVLAYVRHLRKQAETAKLPLTFGPRRSRGLCKRLASGMATGQALEISVRRGISDADWRKVSDGAPGI